MIDETQPGPRAASLQPLPARILIVDDQALNIHAMHRMLSGARHELFMATSGEQALALCRDNPPDLVLLDAMMPGMGGMEVCRRLAADPATADIPVIFVTALSALDDEAKCWDAGCVDFITKPFHAQTLLNRVRVHLLFKQQADQLRELAWLDGLTGLCNRKRFDERLGEELRRCQRSGQPLSVVMIDIDHFKHFNDTYGHPAGDECLRAVAAVIGQTLRRSHDLAARYGGEEFVFLLPDTGFIGAEQMAQQVVQRVRALQHRHAGVEAGIVTLSAGFAEWIPEAAQSPRALLERADRALYRAKADGRDRAVAAS